MDVWKALFSSDGFMPHAGCFAYTPGLIWLHALSDLLIGLSYVAISATLVYLVYRGRNEIPFHAMFLAFGAFIIACGATHFMEIWTLWTPTYWLSGGVKAVTAVASVTTAIALPPLVPLALNMLRDARLSEQRREELETAHEELARAHQEQGELYRQLQEFDELKTRFFANVSHELRTPLTLILGPSERLLAGELAERHHRDLETIARSARLLLRYVNDLLDVSRLEAGRVELEYRETDLARLVRLAAANFEGLAADRGLAFSIEAPESLSAEVDPEKVERVVLNLLSNAFKFAPAGGKVRCTIRRITRPEPHAPAAELEVEDSGPGVPEELRATIFEPFRQGDSEGVRGRGGTGLGLAITQDFAVLHSGRAEVGESELGGARFRVELPLSAPQGTMVMHAPTASGADAPGSAASPAQAVLDELHQPSSPQPSAGAESQPLVLVVEDNPEMSRFISEGLAAHYRVETAADGEEGLQQALALRPDLVLTDVMMPRMSGEELVSAARGHRELDAVPIVVLTAKADDALRVRLLQHGAQDYLMKPFSPDEVRTRVGNLVALKRAREVLQGELAERGAGLEVLATELAARKRELESALDATEEALQEAGRANHVKTMFLRMVSHELRTPLTAMQLQLHRLQRDREAVLTPRQAEIARKIGTASTRLLELIESLLEYARIESGRLDPRLEPTESRCLVRELVDEMRPQAELKSLVLSLDEPADDMTWSTDPRLLRLVLVNLVGNAIKFTDKGTVTVSHGQREGEVWFSVTDSGPGIPAEEQPRMFEPFQQMESMEHKHLPGVGLGLPIAQALAGVLGGRIEVESEEGRGSTFTALFPLTEGEG